MRICTESEIFYSSQKGWSALSIICLTFRQISHFIKNFCLSFSLYKYKFAVLFKTNTVYYLPNKCLRITISIFFPFALPIIYSSHAFGKENTEKLLSRTRAYVLPLLNKLIVFIHWEMFHFLLLHLLLITIEHSWS